MPFDPRQNVVEKVNKEKNAGPEGKNAKGN